MLSEVTALEIYVSPDVIEQLGGYVGVFVSTGVLLGALFGAVGHVVTYIARTVRGGT